MALTVLALYLLAVLDAGLSGYRAAAGLNPLILKRAYHRRAVIKALLWGHVSIMVCALWVGLVLLASGRANTLLPDLTRAAQACLKVYGLYALFSIAAFIGYAIPNRDVRSISIILILGPFTLLRAPVAILGAVWALWQVQRLEVALICIPVIAIMLGLEAVLWRNFSAATSPPRQSPASSRRS